MGDASDDAYDAAMRRLNFWAMVHNKCSRRYPKPCRLELINDEEDGEEESFIDVARCRICGKIFPAEL